MPRYAEGLDHAISDRLATPMAPGTVMGSEAWHAVDTTVMLVELGAVNGLAACVAREVFGMPLLV